MRTQPCCCEHMIYETRGSCGSRACVFKIISMIVCYTYVHDCVNISISALGGVGAPLTYSLVHILFLCMWYWLSMYVVFALLHFLHLAFCCVCPSLFSVLVSNRFRIGFVLVSYWLSLVRCIMLHLVFLVFVPLHIVRLPPHPIRASRGFASMYCITMTFPQYD